MCIRDRSYEEAKKLWGCNEKLARQNFERFRTMDLRRNLTPAILSYEGIQYQYMAPAVFEEEMLSWVQSHLRIRSGFYGVLKPMDGVTPYRLEMQARLSAGGSSCLLYTSCDFLATSAADGTELIEDEGLEA